MSARTYLALAGIVGGLVSALLLGALLLAVTGRPLGPGGWGALLVATPVLFLTSGYYGWYLWSSGRTRARARVLSRLAEGDLGVTTRQQFDGQPEVRRLLLALRRAMSQVQRVTANVHETCNTVTGQARMLLEAARRQGGAVERTLDSVHGMGDSLGIAGKRMGQLESFAQDTTQALGEMTERIEQVAVALSTLNDFADRTSAGVQHMSDRLGFIAQSGDALARFTSEAEDFVAAVEGGIDSVRRRAMETNELALAVTATAERGEALVTDSVQGMYRIEETVRKTAGLVDLLGARSTEIGRIVDVIQEISDRTKLLALNAAIIAAQAGENGRAFGVVADEVRGLAERTARSTRDIAGMVTGVREAVETAVQLVSEGRDQAAAGVTLGDRAAEALKEIRTITQRTFAAVESTVAETKRLEQQGRTVVEASRRVAQQADEVTRAAIEEAGHGREVTRQTHEMARLAHEASQKAEGQARTGRDLADSVLRLTAAIDEIRAAHAVLTRGDATIGDEVSQVREDARRVLVIGDGLARTVEQLATEARELENEVFRFKLPQARTGGTLRLGLHQTSTLLRLRRLDPLESAENQLAELVACVFSTLVRLEDGVVKPDLAERWEMDPTARRYTFTLRRGVTFHDGAPLTAHDVKRHFERLLDPASKSPDQAVLMDLEGAESFVTGREREVWGLRVVDDLTLEVRLREARAFFLHLVALSPTSIARQAADGRLVGTGPFRLVRLDDTGVVLERNPTYHRAGQPWLERLEVVPFPTRGAAVEAARAGSVDLVTYLFSEHASAPGLEDKQVVPSAVPSTSFIGFNLRQAPFDDPRVRRAVRAGLDRAGTVERFHPGAAVARGLVPPGMLEHEGPMLPPRPDVAEAERLLREAGVRGRLRLTLHASAGRATPAEDAVLFGPLVQAGLLELEHVELRPDEYDERMRQGRVPAFRAGWLADYPDPDNFLHYLLHSRGQAYFNFGYVSAEFDRLVEEARVSVDPAQRASLYRRAEAQLHQDCPLIPLFHDRVYAVATPALQNLRMYQTPPQLRCEQVWLDREALG